MTKNRYYDYLYGLKDIEGSGGGGGGCFPEDTMIFTQAGWKPIQTLKQRDIVIGYDVYGECEYGIIIDTFVHSKEENPTGLYTFYWDKDGIETSLQVTGNHAIYSEGDECEEENLSGKNKKREIKGEKKIITHNDRECEVEQMASGIQRVIKYIDKTPKKKREKDTTLVDFKEAKDFIVGDILTDYEGNTFEITRIDHIPMEELDKDFKSYNINVVPQHTYIVSGYTDTKKYSGIRVHNGGGGGGGGKGGGGAGAARESKEAPNTLRTSTVVKTVEVISEGEIVGLVDGAKGIFFNGTPVQAQDSSFNFENVVFEFNNGTSSQSHLKGFPSTEAEVVVNVTVTQATPVIRSTGSTVDAARITIQFPQGLWKQDTTTGDLNGHSVNFAVDTRKTGGVFTQVTNRVISDKTMTIAELSFRIEAPTDADIAGWDIRVRRITADDPLASQKSVINFARFTELQDIKLPYADTAVIGLTVDAKSVGGQVPVRAYDVMGLIVKIPNNYNPVTRVYTGPWNGTFTEAFTDNQSWIIYDLLTSSRYGMGSFVDESTIDKFSFFDAAVYNDQLVDDGNGGTEPRFTFNTVINTRTSAWKLIQTIASSCRSMIFPGGIITMIQDRPRDPVKLITNASIKDGEFTYSSSGRQARSTAVNVTFNDINNDYLPTTISIEDAAGIALYGYNPRDITAFGAVTEGQARRAAQWELDTNLNSLEIVKYECGLNQADVEPGQVVDIIDNDFVLGNFGGKVIGGDNNTVILDREVTLEIGNSYFLGVVKPDGSDIERIAVINSLPSTTDTLELASPMAFTGAEAANREWQLYWTGQVARPFNILAIRELEKANYEYTGLFYDAGKFGRIDTGVSNPDPIFSRPDLNIVAPVTVVTVTRENKFDSVRGRVADLRINWTPPITEFTWGYKIRWRRDNLQFSESILTSEPNFLIENAVKGTYDIIITALNIRGVSSIPVTEIFILDFVGTNSFSPPINLVIQPGHGSGTTFSGRDLLVQFEDNPVNVDLSDPNLIGDGVAGYRIEVRDFASVLLSTRDITKVELFDTITDDHKFNYFFDDNVRDGGPRRVIKIRVFTIDVLARISTNSIEVEFTNPAPGVVSFSLDAGLTQGQITVDMAQPIDTDFAGFYIFMDIVSPVVADLAHVVYKGPDTLVQVPNLPSATEHFFKVAGFDQFTDTIADLNISGEQSVTTTAELANPPQIRFEDLELIANDPINNTVSWSAFTAHRTIDDTTESQAVSAGSVAFTGATQYIYYQWQNSTMSTTTVLSTALGTNKQPAAHYNGDDQLFISDTGVSLFGVIGASHLVTGTAVITESAQIANLTVDSLRIKNAAVTDFVILNQVANIIITDHGITDVLTPPTGGGQPLIPLYKTIKNDLTMANWWKWQIFYQTSLSNVTESTLLFDYFGVLAGQIRVPPPHSAGIKWLIVRLHLSLFERPSSGGPFKIAENPLNGNCPFRPVNKFYKLWGGNNSGSNIRIDHLIGSDTHTWSYSITPKSNTVYRFRAGYSIDTNWINRTDIFSNATFVIQGEQRRMKITGLKR